MNQTVRDTPNPVLVEALRYYAERRTMNNPKGWAHVQRVVNSAVRAEAIKASTFEVAQAHTVLNALVLAESALDRTPDCADHRPGYDDRT